LLETQCQLQEIYYKRYVAPLFSQLIEALKQQFHNVIQFAAPSQDGSAATPCFIFHCYNTGTTGIVKSSFMNDRKALIAAHIFVVSSLQLGNNL
jgi:hypothetical protein